MTRILLAAASVLVLSVSSGCVTMSANIRADIKSDQGIVDNVEFTVHMTPQGHADDHRRR